MTLEKNTKIIIISGHQDDWTKEYDNVVYLRDHEFKSWESPDPQKISKFFEGVEFDASTVFILPSLTTLSIAIVFYLFGVIGQPPFVLWMKKDENRKFVPGEIIDLFTFKIEGRNRR
jgi:hypothetical protein